MTLTIGVDIGGTKVAAGLVTAAGELVAEGSAPTPAEDIPALLDVVAGLVHGLEQQAPTPVVGLGIGAAAFVAADRGTVRFAPNLAWRDLDLAAALQQRTGLTTRVENDANAAAWAEHRFGAGRGVDDLLMVTLGTGVGGGIVLGGQLVRGGFGTAAEIGHLRVERDGRPCGCGQRGCLEQYASGTALSRAAGIPGREVTRRARAGDQRAVAHLAQTGGWLGEGLAGVAAVLDPARIVVGGGVAAAGELLLAPARAAYERCLSGAGHRPLAELRVAELGNRAGMIGAADLARC